MNFQTFQANRDLPGHPGPHDFWLSLESDRAAKPGKSGTCLWFFWDKDTYFDSKCFDRTGGHISSHFSWWWCFPSAFHQLLRKMSTSEVESPWSLQLQTASETVELELFNLGSVYTFPETIWSNRDWWWIRFSQFVRTNPSDPNSCTFRRTKIWTSSKRTQVVPNPWVESLLVSPFTKQKHQGWRSQLPGVLQVQAFEPQAMFFGAWREPKKWWENIWHWIGLNGTYWDLNGISWHLVGLNRI